MAPQRPMGVKTLGAKKMNCGAGKIYSAEWQGCIDFALPTSSSTSDSTMNLDNGSNTLASVEQYAEQN